MFTKITTIGYYYFRISSPLYFFICNDHSDRDNIVHSKFLIDCHHTFPWTNVRKKYVRDNNLLIKCSGRKAYVHRDRVWQIYSFFL